mmetsp:Transcript_27535/g.24407  ORF Transcript_27535/g.24407 Transcript_27535/m.24407 type:complete len:103 (+) Transcript_27535:359-667(+)
MNEIFNNIQEEVEKEVSEKSELINTPPPITMNRPCFKLPLKGLFSKENPVLPASMSTPREETVNKPVEFRLVSLEPLPKINMINIDKFYTQELDKIIEIDQE